MHALISFQTLISDPAYHGRLKAGKQISSSGSSWAPLLQSHASCMPSWACQSGMSSGSLRMSGSRPSSAMRCSSSGPSSKSCVDAGRYSSCESPGLLQQEHVFCAACELAVSPTRHPLVQIRASQQVSHSLLLAGAHLVDTWASSCGGVRCGVDLGPSLIC